MKTRYREPPSQFELGVLSEAERELLPVRYGTCLTCTHATPKENDCGFVACKFMPSWKWLPERHTCHFEPRKWVAR